MAKKKAIAKKKAAAKKKLADKKEAEIAERVNIVAMPAADEIFEPEIVADEDVTTGGADTMPDDEDEIPVVIMETDLIIELCGPGKRCRQRVDGKFIRQNFIAGRWQQVSGTVFSTLEACKTACGG